MNAKEITYEQMQGWLYTWVPKNHVIAEAIRITIGQIETLQAENAALKAEVELLNQNAMKDYAAHLELKCRAEKAEAELDAARPAIKFYESYQAAIAKGPASIKDIIGFDPLEFIKDYARKEAEGKEKP